jgi:2,3-bisphosphoglycerate-dependent phosphoglycerate mutase
MRTEIYMVRHAHSNYSADDYGRGLSEKGRRDAELVTGLLLKEKIDVIFSSPYRRAIETVEGTAASLGLNINIEENFRERELSKDYIDDFESAVKKLWDEPEFAFPGGESNVEAAKRGVKALINLIDKYQGNRAAVGSHGNIMAIIMNHFDKSYDYGFWKGMSMPDIYRLSFEKAELVEVKKIWQVLHC